MSTVRDFDSRSRAGTAGAGDVQPPIALSPITTDHPSRDRRGSTVSKISRFSRRSASWDGMRHRRHSRSNTVGTWHEAESHELEGWLPGAEPGIDTTAEDEELPFHIARLKAQCDINIIDFSSDPDVQPSHVRVDNDDLEEALLQGRSEKYSCRWISVNGLSWDVIKVLGNTYNLHRLAIEDICHTHTRTKVDWYADHACVILTLQKLVMLHSQDGDEDRCDCHFLHDDEEEQSEKHPHTAKVKQKLWWWQRRKLAKARRQSRLPYDLDKNDDGRVDEFVNAHTGTSPDTPIRPARTLHRYESSQIPEHTAFMERHSSLAAEDLAVTVEQVSIFLCADNTVISIFEQSAEDVEDPIRDRIYSSETMLRRSGDASLLLQAIIDAIVDLAIPVRDAYNKARKELQVDAMVNPSISTSRALHIFGEEIDMLQNLIKPIVHLVNAIRDHNANGPVNPPTPPAQSLTSLSPPPEGYELSATIDMKPVEKTRRDREGAPVFNRKISNYRRAGVLRPHDATSVSITPLAHTYFGDVLDHCITMIQALEQMDASATNISTLIFNTVGARTNNFMMILAIVTVLFAPLTFISGYFGQNFNKAGGIDEPFSYFWTVALPVLAAFALLVFATMLWDTIKDWLAKYGMRQHRSRRNKMRRARQQRH
ncbi:hypothetical protein BDY17DRAFT_290538 [Neohortaea acidophila]|uniref:Cora-domain-containing protein n=1 Tax=Neohortaea acidophila TaxID=245834 RepID=A0A6A6Q3B3_9PEZI|nr:uncharacterized protein BDY17DRAFT_290538 [Neohortaea acidophila]KAF2485917.1 hypothetical protein BDY17DRAFT_290538 [Neohortaea acidophila]